MITKNLLKALEELGFEYRDNKSPDKIHAFAIYGDYLVSVYETAGKRTAYFNFKFSDNEENSIKKYEMSEAFSNELGEYSVFDYSISEDGMRVSSNGSIPTFLKLLDRCVSLLKEHEIKGIEYCSKCGNKFGSRKPKKVTIGKENHLMCEHCAIDIVEEVNNKAVQKAAENNTGKVLKGILGSFAFSLLGVGVYFLLYYFLSPAISQSSFNEVRYIFCICGFIVSLLSYYGYRILCKKVSLTAYITIPINAILFTAIGQYIGIVFEFIAKNGFKPSVLSNKHFWLVHLRNTVPQEVADNFVAYSEIFWKLLAISLMFAAIGVGLFLLTLHDKSNIKPETVEIETVSIN